MIILVKTLLAYFTWEALPFQSDRWLFWRVTFLGVLVRAGWVRLLSGLGSKWVSPSVAWRQVSFSKCTSAYATYAVRTVDVAAPNSLHPVTPLSTWITCFKALGIPRGMESTSGICLLMVKSIIPCEYVWNCQLNCTFGPRFPCKTGNC